MALCQAPPQVFGCTWRRRVDGDQTRSVDVFEDDITGLQYAVKTLDLRALLAEGEDKRLAYVRSEVLNHHELLQHPHVIQFHEATFEYPLLCIKMELAKIDMCQFVARYGPLKAPAAQWLFLQLLHAVDYCHRRQVCSRDIKPSNILLDYAEGKAPTLKLCDFGYSKRSTSPLLSLVGTLSCMAPEVIQPQEGARPYSPKVDVWGCGCCLYFMLFKAFPFGTASNETTTAMLKARILSIDWAIPAGAELDDDCADVLRRMLAPAASRWSIEELWGHPWVQKHLPQNVVVYNQHLAERVTDPAKVADLVGLLDAALVEVTRGGGRQRGPVDNQYDAIIYDEIGKEAMAKRTRGWVAESQGCC